MVILAHLQKTMSSRTWQLSAAGALGKFLALSWPQFTEQYNGDSNLLLLYFMGLL